MKNPRNKKYVMAVIYLSMIYNFFFVTYVENKNHEKLFFGVFVFTRTYVKPNLSQKNIYRQF